MWGVLMHLWKLVAGKGLEIMISKYFRLAAAATVILFALSGGLSAQNTPGMPPMPPQPPKTLPFVSTLFGDNMVLQRGKANTVWGWSDPGDKVTVQIGDTAATAVAGADRRWQVKIQPPPAGGPYTVKITGHESVELHNVLVGDVWLCGGQSNMGLPLRFTRNGADEAKAANYPDIRFFTVTGHPAYHHTDVVGGKWSEVTPQTANWVSAVGYYFARKVQHETHVPIGLVLDNMGGTPAEAWTSAEALRPLKDFDIPLAELERLAAAGAPEYGNFVMHWYDEYDTGLKGNWAAPELDDSAWKAVQIPGGFAELGVPDTPALAWFRKEIVLPDPLPAGRAMLYLGVIERMDTAYINGAFVGASSWVENPRVYFGGALKPGRNVIAIRVLKTKADGGFMSKPEDLHIVLGDKTSIPLAGQWKGQLSVDARPPHSLPMAYENWPIMPAVLYEGMLTPVDGDEWAETRESQAITAASVPNSCLAVTIDTGDADNIHSQDKLQVGERLALCALANYYGKKVVYSGPTLKSVDRHSGAIRLHFAHTDGGLVVKGTKLEEFAIAGEDRKWYWADAYIKGKTIIVSSPSVPNPKEVRYAWQSNPAATLFNGAGLPAAPFRTDTWPGMTEAQRPY